MDCPQCRTTNPPSATLCRTCHTPLPGSVITKTPPPIEAQTTSDPLQRTIDDEGQTLIDRLETPGGQPVAKTPTDMAVPTGWSVPAPTPAALRVAGSLDAIQPGTLLANRYEIIRLLGQGGMGAVYQAKDRELDRLVALKVIRPELARRPENLQRFKQELILARQVTHRNVIRIFDLGEAEGIKFITMAYVEGQDLKTIMAERGKVAVEESVRIIQQVCLALEAAHTEGVVHRDLKPQNIMVDQQGRVYVMDFGIARDMELGGGTQTGALLGTPEYMSPEQVQGRKADARSDLFTLGIIFYELLTGKTPYVADTALGTMYKRTQERAAPPAQLDPSVPHFLSDVVGKCLEIEPQRRYQSAREILHDLEAWQLGTSRRALHPVVRWWRYGPPYQKRVAMLLPVIILAVSGVVFLKNLRFFSKSSVPYPQVSLAVLPFRNVSGDPNLKWLDASLAEMLSTDIGQSSRLTTISSNHLRQVLQDLRIANDSELDPATVRRLGQFTAAEMIVSGQFVKAGDKIRIDAKLEDLKRERTASFKVEAAGENQLLSAVDQLAASIRGSLTVSRDMVRQLQESAFKPSTKSIQALRYYNEGRELARQGNDLQALQQFQASTNSDPEFALAFSALGQTYARLGYDSEAGRFSSKAVDLSANLPARERYLVAAQHAETVRDRRKAVEAYENLAKVSPDDLDVQFALAGLYESVGRLDEARDHYARVLKSDPKYVSTLLAMGRVSIKSGKYEGAMEYLNQALGLAIQLDNQEERATILQAMGNGYKFLNKTDEALRNYEESLAIKRRLGQKRGMASSLNEIAEIQVRSGKPEAALASYQEALKLGREIGDRDGVGSTLIHLGILLRNRGENDAALKLYKESLQIQREIGNQRNESACLNNIGSVHFARGEFGEALTYFQQALLLREKGDLPQEKAITEHNLAETTARRGEYEQALGYYLRALESRRKADDRRGAAIESYSIGTLFQYQGRYGAARKSKEEALQVFRELHDRSFWMAEILSGYGSILAELGYTVEARKPLEEAISLARELNNQGLISQTARFEGDSFYYQGDFHSAYTFYERALEVAKRSAEPDKVLLARLSLLKLSVQENSSGKVLRDLKLVAKEAKQRGFRYEFAQCSVLQAQILLNTHNKAETQSELETALAENERLELRMEQAKTHYLMATVLRFQGKQREAIGQYQTTLRLLDEMVKESGTGEVLKRADVIGIATDARKRTIAAGAG